MEYTTAISFLNVMPDTQSGIQLFVDQVLSQVENRQAIPLLAKLSAMEKIIKGVKDGIKDSLMAEADMEADKTFVLAGVKYTKSQKSTYYYNHAAKWRELDKQITSLQDMMKAAQSPFADPDTGEIIQPARKTVSEYLKIELPR